MKVEAEVKIKILDGEEKGKVDTFRTVGETDTQNTEYGIIECLRLEWRHIHNASSWGEPCGTDKTYTEELNAVRQELLERGDEVVSFRQLVERFDEIEEAYKGVPWNLMQIYSNFNILIGKRVSDYLHGYLTSCLQQYEGEWIPVSEKLPEENKTVIASTKYGVYPETRYTKNGWEWAYEAGADYWRELEDVTAWMPLPEKPYEEGDK